MKTGRKNTQNTVHTTGECYEIYYFYPSNILFKTVFKFCRLHFTFLVANAKAAILQSGKAVSGLSIFKLTGV